MFLQVEMMSREKIRDIADQQVMFNEALNKAMDEKNRQLKELQEKLSIANNSEKNNGCKDSDLVQQLADTQLKNTQLEAELKEAKSRLDQMMTTSVMTLNSSVQVYIFSMTSVVEYLFSIDKMVGRYLFKSDQTERKL
jgi:EAL domain-containing protein (putative c-di-GMP-specific phosphodiesterase class I)